MKRTFLLKENRLIVFLFLFLSFFTESCLDTKTPREPSAGPNLGFEFSDKGLPANWILYDPPQFDYSVSTDTSAPKEGRQSLRFDIRRSPAEGRMNYAGFTNEFPELTKSGGRYRLSFWIKNSGTRYRIFAGGVSAKEAALNPVLLEDSASIVDWKKSELTVDIPSGMWLRFETRLNGIGTFWIDQVEIEKLP